MTTTTPHDCGKLSCDCCHDDRLDSLTRDFAALKIEARTIHGMTHPQRRDFERRLRDCVTNIKTISAGKVSAEKPKQNPTTGHHAGTQGEPCLKS